MSEEILVLGDKYFPAQETVGNEEIAAVNQVMQTGILSNYRGNSGPNFMGGRFVQKFEEDFADYHDTYAAVAVNSCTSALQIACIAIDLYPNDTVLVTPWSMCCSATAPLICGSRPVFADIDDETYCMSLESIKRNIRDDTRAIIAVDLFGSLIAHELRDYADSKGILLIEDAAQSIGGFTMHGHREFSLKKHPGLEKKTNPIKVEKAGTIGHMGCFSFTQGKHITAGEGGMIISNNPIFIKECRYIRNHYESIIHDLIVTNCRNKSDFDQQEFKHYGFNMRMTELQAAILIEQLKKLPRFLALRNSNAERLKKIFSKYTEFLIPRTYQMGLHAYYVYAIKVNQDIPVNKITNFVDSLNDILPKEFKRPDKKPFNHGYIDPLYNLPIFKQGLNKYTDPPISLQVVEHAQKFTIITTLIGLHLTEAHFKLIENAVEKSIILLR